ncbi:hypothetical protein SEA_PERIWINKLE_72 [Gordonia phage Periwinkle]|nr:hypothetical protein SEA_PERIWINKLE_72 [Gordonia phage Periwinkle]
MKAAVVVSLYLLFVAAVVWQFPPVGREGVATYAIIVTLGLMTVVAFCLPKPVRDVDDWDVVGRALRVLPPDGGEQ